MDRVLTTAVLHPGAVEDPALPDLRDDLALLSAAPAPDGSPSWTLFDPVRNRYFRIGWVAFELLSRWSVGTRDRILGRIREETTCSVEEPDLDALILFLQANSLTNEPPGGNSREYAARSRAMQTFSVHRLVQNYLFFRVPLFHPDAFLDRTLPWVRAWTGRRAVQSGAGLGVLGLFLISRQWDAFVATFLHFFSWSGLALYLVTQAGVKVIHEFGHAYTAKRYGCRVPVMGVAFMLFYPVLYTDTSDAWRLRRRRERLHIAGAGILAELWLAALASVLWAWLPDGALRSVAFIVASTSWVMTLAVNLNPFMRFDGYYLLGDALGVDNLQERSFAWGRFRLRRMLFGLDEWAPHPDTKPRRRALTAYAFGTWLYRFLLFLGIALLVYHFFIKVLGVALFIIEITWFMVLPVIGEFRDWWSRRDAILEAGRWKLSGGLLLVLMLLAFIPWGRSVALPAVLAPAHSEWVFAPEPARVREVHIALGDHVEAGQLLMTLELPSLDSERRKAEKEGALIEIRARRMAVRNEDRDARHVLVEQLAENAERVRSIEERRVRLELRALRSGQISDLDPTLHPGRWVSAELPLLFLFEPASSEIRAFANETEVHRIQTGDSARFIPDDLATDSVSAEVTDVALADAPVFDLVSLASEYGGPIAVRVDPEDGSLVPEDSVYPIRLAASEPTSQRRLLRGVVHIRGEARSFASAAFSTVASTLVRESGF